MCDTGLTQQLGELHQLMQLAADLKECGYSEVVM